MTDFFERLDKYIDFKGLNDNKLTKISGLSNGLIGKARKRGFLSLDNVSKLLFSCEDLNAHWLLTGHGEMINNTEFKNIKPKTLPERNVLDVFSQIANSEGITIYKLEQKIGASKGVLSKAIANSTDIQCKWLIKLVETFPQYNPNWILTGKGEMTTNEELKQSLEKKNNIKERVLYFAKKQNISIEFFLKSIDMTYGSFKGKAKEGSLNSDAIEKILINYPDISIEWLLTGNGDMKKNISTNVFKSKSDHLVDNQAIPLYNIEASAGIVALFNDSYENEPVNHIQIPNLPKCDGAIYITGDSMYPLLKSGDIIMYKQVHNIRESIFFGEMYLISFKTESDEMITIKYVQKSDRGDDFVKLVSQNTNYDDKDISIANINAMALVKASIRINSMS
ncbi:S24 family peptidase [Flavobacterium sp. WV_118_3]|uniref:S24 family peptidase n=1 Tax=Flavobacterium sp. WV_118_3 TaxID=3151764 RepID=UPI003218F71B